MEMLILKCCLFFCQLLSLRNNKFHKKVTALLLLSLADESSRHFGKEKVVGKEQLSLLRGNKAPVLQSVGNFVLKETYGEEANNTKHFTTTQDCCFHVLVLGDWSTRPT